MCVCVCIITFALITVIIITIISIVLRNAPVNRSSFAACYSRDAIHSRIKHGINSPSTNHVRHSWIPRFQCRLIIILTRKPRDNLDPCIRRFGNGIMRHYTVETFRVSINFRGRFQQLMLIKSNTRASHAYLNKSTDECSIGPAAPTKLQN